MEQVSTQRKELDQEIEITSEIGGNNPRRKRNVSGPGSEGEKSLLKKNPDWLISPKVKTPILNSCLASFDDMLATPLINVSVFGSASNPSYKIFEEINNSKSVAYIDSMVSGFGFFAVSIGFYVNRYCKLREIERNSHYFFYKRFVDFLAGLNEDETKNIFNVTEQDNLHDPISSQFVSDTAYFYPPDISKIARWRRRFFAIGKARKQLKALKKFLRRNSEKDTLNELYEIIVNKVCLLLNNAGAPKNFQVKREKNQWTIGLEDNYAEKFFKCIENQIDKNSNDKITENKKKTKNFIPAILTALMQASFIYWVSVFFFILFLLPP